MKIEIIDPEVEAFEVTVHNINQVADWCKGSVYGIALPITDRVIRFHRNGAEIEAEVGDYIVRTEGDQFHAYSPYIFNRRFKIL